MKELFKKYWYVLILVICLILIYGVWYNFDNSDINESIVYEDVGVELENEKVIVEEVDTYFVDIKGEIVKPGVYEISNDSRIVDVIKMAGGLTKNADTSLLNLSKKVKDEMNIRIYSKKEVLQAKENLKKEPEIIEVIKEVEKECVCPEVNNKCDINNDALANNENEEIKVNQNDKVNNEVEKEDKKEESVDKENVSKKEESVKEEDNLVNINTANKEQLMSIPNIGETKAEKIIEYRNKNKFNKIEDILNVSGIGESIFDKIKKYITV